MKLPSRLAIPLSLCLVVGAARAEVVERVVAKVGGHIITLSEFEGRQIAALQAARVSPDRVEAFLRENNARILQQAIDDLLLVDRAADLEIRMPPEYLNQVIDNIKKENKIGSDEELLGQLRQEGMSLDDLKRSIERSVLSRQVIAREIEPKVTVTEAELQADYQSRIADFTQPAFYHLQEILVRTEDAEAMTLAQSLVARARSGEDFAELARAHSSSPTRAVGGDLGQLKAAEISADLRKVAASLQPAEVSDPIPSGEGYRILRMAGRSEEAVTPFEKVRNDVRKRLLDERLDKAINAYVENLRKTAVWEVRVREVPLQVAMPSAPSPFLEPPVEPTDAKPRPRPTGVPAGEDEISTTPQAKPERVTPQPPAGPPEERRPPGPDY
jgi:parvulin-like peptidyl-prolyl isomerase